MAEISKAARNEQRKLFATYLNNVALTFFVAGIATPYFTWLNLPYGEAARLLSGLPETLRVTPIVAIVASLILSAIFHYLSRGAVDNLED